MEREVGNGERIVEGVKGEPTQDEIVASALNAMVYLMSVINEAESVLADVSGPLYDHDLHDEEDRVLKVLELIRNTRDMFNAEIGKAKFSPSEEKETEDGK